MFSCRPRVELVAAASCSPCVHSGGCKSALGKLPAPKHRYIGLRSLKEFSHLPWPHVLCVLELLLLIVVPLGQDVEQQQVT
jgi:hypothetical protein